MSTEIKEITAYQCNCGNAFFERSRAEECCAPKYCACGVLIAKSAIRCCECSDRKAHLNWECAERRSSAPDQLLYSEKIDDYFGKYIDLMEALDDESEGYEELKSQSVEEFARQYRVYLCEPKIPAPINLFEHYEDFCDEDGDLPDDWDVLGQAIKDWIEVNRNFWPHHPTKIAWNGVVEDKSAQDN
jgi:hypothetical protein